ncbi:hypothetical protein [Pseudomonas sp. 34 E 7]|nr:hypothetical protein [Pseudomonas sp. 34 E 7]
MALRRVKHLDGHPRQAQGAAFRQFDLHEHGLEQRAGTRPVEGFEDLFIRQGLLVERRRHAVAGAQQGAAKVRVVLQALANHQGVEQRPDQRRQLGAIALRHRRTQAQVTLAAVARQQASKGGQAKDVQGHALLADGPVHLRRQVSRQFAHPYRAAMATLVGGRTRMIAGQGQRSGRIGQLVAPVIELLAAGVAGQPLVLPGGIVGVLDVERRQLGWRAQARGTVALGQLAGQLLGRPRVVGDVVDGEEQPGAALFGIAERAPAPWHFAAQVEGLGQLPGVLVGAPLLRVGKRLAG